MAEICRRMQRDDRYQPWHGRANNSDLWIAQWCIHVLFQRVCSRPNWKGKRWPVTVADCCRNSSLAYSSPGKNCTLCCSTQGQISRRALFQCAQQKEWLYFMYVKLQFAPLLSYLLSLYVHELILLSLTQDQRISNYLLFSFIFLFWPPASLLKCFIQILSWY